MGKKAARINFLTICLIILLICTYLLSFKVTSRVSRAILDGDTSAELVLSEHLSKTNHLLAKDWYYSTELRVLYSQIVFSFLFRFISDWTTVRIYGTMILQLILVLSFAYMMVQAIPSGNGNKKVNTILAGCILILLPYCLCYGEIVLYHFYYIPNIAISFLLIGLLCFVVNHSEGEKHNISYIVHFTFLLLLSLLSTLSGYRQILILFLPLFFTVALHAIRNDNTVRKVEYQRWIKPILFMFLAALCGLFVNLFILKRHYTFSNYSEDLYLVDLSAEKIIEQLNFILAEFGYQSHISLYTVQGILSLLGLFICAYCLIFSITALFTDNSKEISTMILQSIMIPGICCIFLSDLLTDMVSNERYYLPVTIWIIPMLVSRLYNVTAKNLIADAAFIICISGLYFNGFYNMGAYYGSFHNNSIEEKTKMVSSLQDCAKFISDNNYDYGITTFWEAAVITELTDGIPVSNVGFAEDAIMWNNWLTLESIRHQHYEKAFLMIINSDRSLLDKFEGPFSLVRAFEGKYYTVYTVDDADSLISFIDGFGAKAYPRIIEYQ